MTQDAPKRVFVLGCQRSGTSVLHAVFTRVANLLPLLETQYFVHLLGGYEHWVFDEPELCRRKWRSRLALMRARTYSELKQDLDFILSEPELGLRLRFCLTGRAYIGELMRVLDAAARRRGTVGWAEKTPSHLAYVDVIQEHMPGTYFIHILRNGEDAVASLIDAETRYYRERWFYGGVGYAVRQWNRSIDTHLACAGRPGHLVLRHEDLVADPERTLACALEFVGLPTDQLATRLRAVPQQAELEAAPWKAHWVNEPLLPPRIKFEALLGPQLQKWVREHLRDYDQVSEIVQRKQPGIPQHAAAPAPRRIANA